MQSISTVTRRRFMHAAAAVAAVPGARAAAKKVRVGVVGGRFGLQFQWHLHPDSQVVAVCDIRPERLDALRSTYRAEAGYKDYRDMLRHPGLDAVALFTPAPLHAWMAIEAMNAGKHVISAVPAGISLEELQRLVETVKSSGMRYAMAETTYYRPQIITCRRWAAEHSFGEIFYSESEYHHNITNLMYDERGLPTWRHGYPPMYYITHQTGAIVPVTGERLVEVRAIGWGDGHEVLQTNRYQNPFWNTVGFFTTERGHASRIAIYWHAAAGFAQRSQFHGSKRSYISERQLENHPDIVMRWAAGEEDKDLPEKVEAAPADDPPEKYWDLLPEPLRLPGGHAGAHNHITHDFISAIVDDRHPEVNIWEAANYTAPGLVAHRSALNDGEVLKIPDFGRASS